MQGRYAALWALSVGAAAIAGGALERFVISAPSGDAAAGPSILYWVAPMDPNFRKDGPGKSPMGMDLVPVYEGAEPSGDPAEVTLSAAEINAIGVRTAVARVEAIAERVETVGFIGYDEHATSHIHTRTEGWIEKLKVRAIGDRVAEGDLLYELYAPEITIASSELMRAAKRRDPQEADIAARKLKNLGVADRQIAEMAAATAPAQHIRVYAPQDGVVVALAAADGMYLKPETRAMTITDLSTVWLLVDVFERDVARLSPDMTAAARFEALPGRVFEGEIDYVYPELDPKTRTLRVRLRFENADGQLKPNMFAAVTLTPTTTRQGVTVPSEAVIRTGRADRVILRTGEGVFRPRLVTIGLRDGFGAGGRTEILQGLAPGDEVVASAQFLIDSESALSAGLTRFAPTDAAPAAGKGELLAFDAATRTARIRHDAIAALDWPAMETAFAVRGDVALGRAKIGDVVKFEVARGADGRLALIALGLDDGIDAVGTGVVHAVTEEGELSLSHDPIPALGWPAMTMDLPVRGFDPTTAPIGEPVELALAKAEGGLYAVVGVRRAGAAADRDRPDPAEVETSPVAAIVVDGVVRSVDAGARVATVEHGPIAEIGMPGMTMAFELAPDVDPDALPIGREIAFEMRKNPDFSLTIVGFEAERAR